MRIQATTVILLVTRGACFVEHLQWFSQPGQLPPANVFLLVGLSLANARVPGGRVEVGAGGSRALVARVTRRVLPALPCSLLTVKDEDLIDEIHETEMRTVDMLLAEGRALLGAKSYEPAIRKFNQGLSRIPALEGCAQAYERLGQGECAAGCRRRADAFRLFA